MISCYTKAYKRGLKPPPQYTVSEWADKHRILPSKASAEPGPWLTERNPVMREPMDALSLNNGINKVVLMKPTQIGGTEIGNNWIGATIAHYPVPMMMVLPTVELAKRASKQRVNPMIESTPALKGLVADNRSRAGGNSILSKDFEGGVLIITGANSAVGLRSMPVCNLFLDEIDGYVSDVDGEGDPVEIAEKRTDTFNRKKKIFYCSTPASESSSKIAPLYERSDQRRYHVPCPKCHELQTLKWRQLQWKGKGKKLKVWYSCEHCDFRIDEHNKTWMLEKGEWIAEAESEEDGLVGYTLNALYSPAGWFSWRACVIQFFKAKAAMDRKDFEKMKTFTNTVLAEVWDENIGEQVDDDVLFKRREKYPARVPDEGFILTCGVDVQEDRLELETVAWGIDEESWGIEYRILHGDPTQQEVWDDLDKYIFNSKFRHESGQDLRILATAIDSGYLTKIVYNFVKPRQKSRVYATKGKDGEGRPIVADISRRQKGIDKRQITLYTIGVDEAKTILHRRLRYQSTGSGYCHFPISADYNEEFFAQLAGEKLVKKHKRGFTVREWQKTRPRNESLDIRVLNHAALSILNPHWEAIKEQLNEGIKHHTENAAASEKGLPAIKRKPTTKRRRVRSRGLT